MTHELSSRHYFNKEFPGPKWVVDYASQIALNFGHLPQINIASGISLSGPVHVGHLREFMTAATVVNSLRAGGYDVCFTAFADDMDPLKRRYNFLPENYQQFVGVPLYLIPSNFDSNLSYSDYFLNQFTESLHKLGIDAEIRKSSDSYNSGVYQSSVTRLMRDRAELLNILKEISGTKKENIWPYRFVCPRCHSSSKTNVLDYVENTGETEVSCQGCHQNSSTNISTNGGKLMWRFDWPTRWATFNTHAEPVAQDHASKGGSFDTSEAILIRYFNKKAPIPIKYAWVKHREQDADLHTSTGVISVRQLVDLYPLPVIWSMYTLPEPRNPILFGLKDSLVDETKKLLSNETVLNKIIPKGAKLSPAFYRQDLNTILNYISTGRPIEDISSRDLTTLINWIKNTSTEPKLELSFTEKEFVFSLKSAITQITDWTPVGIKKTITQLASEKKLPVKDAARIIYKTLFSTTSGPSLPQYFSEFSKEDILNRLSFE